MKQKIANQNGINVLSLFDGISGGQIALERAGIKVANYFSSEIDQYAQAIVARNYPKTKFIGDVTKVKGSELPPIDLIIGGSPCQGFSFARGSKTPDFDDPRSQLFFEFHRLIEECQPTYFLLENVKMKKESQDVISKYLGVEPIAINSALVSAQNRQRLYWTNIPNVTVPIDRGILLVDIIEDGLVDRDKSYCIDANFYKGGNHKQYFEKCRRQLVFGSGEGHRFQYIPQLIQVGIAEEYSHYKGQGQCGRVYSPLGKAPALTTMSGGNREPKVYTGGAIRGRYNADGSTSQQLEVREGGKTNALTTVQKDNVLVSKELLSKLHWRKLTVLECSRLQTLPYGYTEEGVFRNDPKYDPVLHEHCQVKKISKTQQFKAIGNGWTVDVVAHLFEGLKDAEQIEEVA
tara:strand:+ start:83 stop:1294 length:1212 start_codon:yes stop_codon:yes gene_type:complete